MKESGKRILFVDDEISILELLTTELKSRGYVIDAVSEPAEAIKLISQKKYDVIFCDLSMPSKLTSFDVLRAVKSIEFRGRFYFMTGHTEGSSLMDFAVKEVGRINVLTKPLRLKELLNILEK